MLNPRRFHPRSLAAALGAAVISLIPLTPAAAQDPGTVVSSSSKPFTETMKEMVSRQKAQPRPAQVLIKAPPEKESGDEENNIVDPGYPPVTFPAPRFNGISVQALGSNFAGVSLIDEINNLPAAYIPPDTQGAIGPNHFMMLANGAAAVYNRSTGNRLSLVTLDTFFTIKDVNNNVLFPIGGSFDPRLLYDRRSGRWLAVALDFGTNNHNGQIGLAISRTSDPTGTWDKYRFTAGSSSSFADYETLGTDDNGVYFGFREFLDAGGSQPGIFATPKASLLAGSPSMGAVTRFTPSSMYSTPQPATNFDAVSASAPFWFFSSSSSVYGNVNYAKVTWSGTTPSLSGTSVLTTPAFGPVPSAPSSGSATNIDSGDMRLMPTIVRNNRLWTSRTIGTNSTGGSTGIDRSGCEWFEIDVSGATPTVLQNGRIYDTAASNPRYYFYPTIMVSGQGHATIGFSGTKSTEFPTSYYCQRLKTDSNNTMGAINVLKAGAATYTLTDNSGRNRFGDYSLTTLDPNDDMTLWTVQEYALSTANRWGTWVGATTAPAPTLNNPNGSGSAGTSNVTLNLTGTGFYDPGAGFTNRLSATLTGGATNGISNYVVTYTSPTSATLKFDIAANASAGARNLTLTNPDGQSVTVTNAFNVTTGNNPPTANAGPDQSASVAADGTKPTITLDGTGSSDPDGDALTYEWSENSTVMGTSATMQTQMGAGIHTITLKVTDTHGAWATDTAVITITGRAATLTSSNVTTTVGAKAKLSGTLKAGTTVVPNATVEFFVNGASQGTALTNSSGVATLTYLVQPPVGSRTFQTKFYGDDVNAAANSALKTITVNKGLTKLTASNVSAKVGANATLKATLKSGTLAVAGATVTFTVNGSSVGTAVTNSSGVATKSWKMTESVGVSMSYSASYAGDSNYNAASSNTATLTALQAATKLVGDALTSPAGTSVSLGAKLTRTTDNKGLAGKTVNFYASDGTTFIAAGTTDSTGRATITVTAPAAGVTDKYVVKFAGDTNYLATSGTASVRGS